jgi:ligand-binding sensor domain-containing protein
LSRFDGSEFKNYYHKPEDSTSIPFFCVDKVIVDKVNNVWAFCFGRPAMVLNKSNDCFYPYTLGSGIDSRISDIALGPDKNVWLSKGKTLYSYQADKKKTHRFKIECKDGNPYISDAYGPQIAFDNKDGIWLYYWDNYEYQIFKGTIQKDSVLEVSSFGKIRLDQFKSATVHNNIGDFNIYISESEKIWLFTKYGLFYFDDDKGSFLKNEETIHPEEFKGKRYFVWAEEKTGIQIIDTKNNLLTSLKTKNDHFIETLFIDQSGRLWCGDINQLRENIGLNRYQKIPEYFKHLLTNKDEKNNPNSVISLHKDRNNYLWAGVKYKDYIFRITTDGTEEKVNYLTPVQAQNQSEARGFAEDSCGIWIGTENGQLINYDFNTRKYSKKYPIQDLVKDASWGIHNIFKSRNSIIINGVKGVYRFVPQTNSMELNYTHQPKGTGFILVPDQNNGYWLGTYTNTVIHLDSAIQQTNTYRFGNGTNIVEHICLGDNNDIWTALMGGGLGHLDLESRKTEIFSTADGLPSNITKSILKDKRGNLWISTDQGISMFNPQTKHFRNFAKEDGLMITDFNSDSYFQSPEGEMFFGGIGGLVSFHPDSIVKNWNNNVKKPLFITDLKVSGISRNFKHPVYEMDSLKLEKGDNNFQVTFVCLDLYNPEKIKYRYRIAENNGRWTEVNYRNRNISFANLSPGDYKLEIEATDKKEEWNLKSAVLISIPFKFNETFWFKLFISIIVLAVLVTFGLVYIKQIRLKERHKQDELKLESLRGQMNPHFIFNSLNSINYFISNNDKISANSYIADFSRLIRSFLNNLSKDFISYEKEIETLYDYLNLEHLRFGDKFDYSLKTDLITNGEEFLIFPGIVQPFIENAIWHGVRGLEGRKGFIQIVFSPGSKNSILCVIEDDGIGRKLAQAYMSEMPWKKSRGLRIINERLKIINQMRKSNYSVTIEDLFTDNKETGTRVTVEIPIKNIE